MEDLTISEYGQYIDLGTNILDRTIELEDGTTPLTDWRIFKKEDDGVWLILADYMPKNKLPSGINLTTGSDSNNLYGLYHRTNREGLINELNSENWKKLILENSELYCNLDVVVKGAFELEEWIGSWEDSGYCKINTSTNSNGYHIYKDGESEEKNWTSLDSDTEGYGDTLYFPHKSDLSMCKGYWLASPSAYSTIDVINICFDGTTSFEMYNSGAAGEYYGVRPAVFLPNNIELDKSADVWNIAN